MMNYYTNMVLSPFIILFCPKTGQETRGGKHFKCLPPLNLHCTKIPWIIVVPRAPSSPGGALAAGSDRVRQDRHDRDPRHPPRAKVVHFLALLHAPPCYFLTFSCYVLTFYYYFVTFSKYFLTFSQCFPNIFFSILYQ